jgi:hypothetical protein
MIGRRGGKAKKRRTANRGLEFPDDGLMANIDDVGESDVPGGVDMCGNCGELRGAHLDGVGPCAFNDCKRFRET